MTVKNRLWLWVLIALLSTTAAFAQTPATMNTPTPGSTLPGSSVTFVWDPGSGASSYWLSVGTQAPGSSNIYDQGQGLNTSATVNNIPTDGAPLYVRLYSVINGVYQYNDYTYTEAYVAVPAAMISPTPGSTLTSSTVTFQWNTGKLVSEYWLWIGTTAGSNNLYDQNQLLNTSVTVGGLPTDGAPLYVRLFSLIHGVMQYNDYVYTEVLGAKAVINSPTPGTTLPGTNVTFTWSGGSHVSQYWLWIGTAVGTQNIYDASAGLNTSANVTVPALGGPLYVRLFSVISGVWQYNDYIYTEATGVPASMNSPSPGSILPGPSVTFNWSTGTSVNQYWLWIGTSPGTENLYDASQQLNTSVTVNNLPTNGNKIYVRLFSYIGSHQSYNDYVYTAAPGIKADMNTPTPGTSFTGSSATFTWSGGNNVSEYWLWVGTQPGTQNLYDANQHLNTSTTVNNLPISGIPIYVRLFSDINGVFQYNDYTYTAYLPPPTPAQMLTPTPGGFLPDTTTTFTWNAGYGATEYWLYVGSGPGKWDYYDVNQHLNLSATVSGLPQDGTPVYVRLFSYINGVMQYNDYTYRASLPSQPVVTVSSTNHPQVAQYTIIVPKDGLVSVQYGLTGYNLTTNQVPAPAGGGITKLYVAGMLANSLYHMQASIAYSDGSSWQDIDRTFTTGGLDPTLAPGITIQTPNPGLTPSPGIELVNGLRPKNGQVQVFATDLQGNIIWYYIPPETNFQVNPIKLLPNGNMMLLMGGSVGTLREIDLAGNTVHDFNLGSLQNALTAAGYNWTVSAMHHDFLRLPNGHTLLLIDRNKVVNGTTLLGDQIVDLDPNYNIVWLWDSFDHLDTNRFPYGFTPTSDWTHSNALFYSPVDGSLLLSIRHQSWVIKIDYNNGAGTGNVLWRFGYQGDFTIATDATDWQFGQHNPSIISQNGSLLSMSVFDDGNWRVDANGLNQCDGTVLPCHSRNVIYNFDETAKTASLSWSYSPAGVFSQATGSSQLLPNGDMEADFAFIYPTNSVRIIETTREATPRVVWELDLSGENSYRSTRLGSLYPGVQW